jgi:threonine/homoserine/homoserine lactone efflux protein
VDGVVAVLFLTFLGVSALVIITPGQDTALTIRNTLRGGRRDGVLTACGVATGQVAWAVATSAGLAALLVASEPAFRALRLFGAAYLVFLGAQSLLRALRRSAAKPIPPGKRRPYRQGLISNLGNPKMAVFFSSLLPQFVPGTPTFVSLFALGIVFCAMTFAWLSLYAAVVERAGAVLRRPRVHRWLDAVTGTVLVALGLRVATTR